MYPVGELADEKAAQKIISKLSQKSILSKLTRNDDSDLFCIWVEKEEDLPFAIDCYRVALGFGKPMEIDPEWERIGKIPLGQISLSLILTSIIVFACMNWIPNTENFVKNFFISQNGNGFLLEVRYGQIWRLLTPIFLHFGFLHIIFNSMWIKDLGSLIEHAKGQMLFIYLILITGIGSNLLQYLVSGPGFGGLSGVVFACLGFIWMQKKFCSKFEYGLPKRDVWFMLAYLFICMTGMFGPIANMAHAGGLSLGMLLGIFVHTDKIDKNSFLYVSFAILISFAAIGVEWVKRDGLFFFHSLI